MDDSALYTGVDQPDAGTFGNEELPEQTQAMLREQEHQLKELTPQLEGIVAMLDNEKRVTLDFIAGYVDETKDSDENYRVELKAAGRYRKYLDELKTKFSLALNEVKGK